MNQSYYLQKEGRPDGPYSIDELKSHNLTHHSLIWEKGHKRWRPVASIPELKTVLQEIPPAYKTTQQSLVEAFRSNAWVKVLVTVPLVVSIITAWAIVDNRTADLNLKVDHWRQQSETYQVWFRNSQEIIRTTHNVESEILTPFKIDPNSVKVTSDGHKTNLTFKIKNISEVVASSLTYSFRPLILQHAGEAYWYSNIHLNPNEEREVSYTIPLGSPIPNPSFEIRVVQASFTYDKSTTPL